MKKPAYFVRRDISSKSCKSAWYSVPEKCSWRQLAVGGIPTYNDMFAQLQFAVTVSLPRYAATTRPDRKPDQKLIERNGTPNESHDCK
jgi:hypothetical protein